MQGTPSDNLSG
jgi:hypothetical protein